MLKYKLFETLAKKDIFISVTHYKHWLTFDCSNKLMLLRHILWTVNLQNTDFLSFPQWFTVISIVAILYLYEYYIITTHQYSVIEFKLNLFICI